MLKYILPLLLLSSIAIGKQRVEFVMCAPQGPEVYTKTAQEYHVLTYIGVNEYVADFFSDDPGLKKIVFLDYCQSPRMYQLPKSKMILFKWEATKIPMHYYEPFSKVFTLDDDLVDGVKFFKFYYPALHPMIDNVPSFQEKKLCTMVNSNWTDDRVKWVKFFEGKPEGEFEFYGRNLGNGPRKNVQILTTSKNYRGPIVGSGWNIEKIETESKYRFCICLENAYINGYLSEKIFGCFAAGCIPVFLGPENVLKYIPAGCFVNVRDFNSKEEIYQYMKSMDEATFNTYIENIRNFIQSDAAKHFTFEAYNDLMHNAISS